VNKLRVIRECFSTKNSVLPKEVVLPDNFNGVARTLRELPAGVKEGHKIEKERRSRMVTELKDYKDHLGKVMNKVQKFPTGECCLEKKEAIKQLKQARYELESAIDLLLRIERYSPFP